MPTSTKISKYPEGMLDVIEAVCETRKHCDIPYPTQRAAKAERLRFYGLIRALYLNQHSLAELATRLEVKLIGQDPKNKNVVRIGFPQNDANDAFYRKIAEKHIKQTPPSNA